MWVAAAVLVSLVVALSANLASYLDLPGFNGQATVLLADDANGAGGTQVGGSADGPAYEATSNPANKVLTLRLADQDAHLSFSSQSELLRFSLESESDFTLRYVTLSVESTGLLPLSDWAVYEWTKNGLGTQLGQQLGPQIGRAEGVQWQGFQPSNGPNDTTMNENAGSNLVRLRFWSPDQLSTGYQGTPGEHVFVIYARVSKAPAAVLPDASEAALSAVTTSPEPQAALTIDFPESLPTGMNWSWLQEQYTAPWLHVSESLGRSKVLIEGELPWQKVSSM